MNQIMQTIQDKTNEMHEYADRHNASLLVVAHVQRLKGVTATGHDGKLIETIAHFINQIDQFEALLLEALALAKRNRK